MTIETEDYLQECLQAMNEASNAIVEFLTVYEVLIAYKCDTKRLIAANKSLCEIINEYDEIPYPRY